MQHLPSPPAIHEAGHAVVCIALGGRVCSLTIADGDGSGMATLRHPFGMFSRAAVSAGGPVAEAMLGTVLFGGAWDWRRCASKGDWENLHRAARGFGVADDDEDGIAQFIDEAGRRAREIIKARWPAVCELADRLDAEGTIDFDSAPVPGRAAALSPP